MSKLLMICYFRKPLMIWWDFLVITIQHDSTFSLELKNWNALRLREATFTGQGKWPAQLHLQLNSTPTSSGQFYVRKPVSSDQMKSFWELKLQVGGGFNVTYITIIHPGINSLQNMSLFRAWPCINWRIFSMLMGMYCHFYWLISPKCKC